MMKLQLLLLMLGTAAVVVAVHVGDEHHGANLTTPPPGAKLSSTSGKLSGVAGATPAPTSSGKQTDAHEQTKGKKDMEGVSFKKQTPVNATLPEYLKFMKEVQPKITGFGAPAATTLWAPPPSSGNARQHQLQDDKVWVVMGANDAGLTSVASALVFAQFQAEVSGIPVIPLINFNKADLHIHKDIELVIEQAGIDKDDLIFLDDIDIADLVSSDRMKLTLVDHNELAPTQSCAANAIVGIVDNHKDARQYLNIVTPAREIQSSALSATTVVAQALLRHPIGKNMLTQPAVATLLRSATLLALAEVDEGKKDTVDATIKETTTELCSDEDAFGMDSDKWEEKLVTAKQDFSNLTTQDILRRNMKAGLSGKSYFVVTLLPSMKELELNKKDAVISFIVFASKFANAEGFCWVWALTEGVDGNTQLIVLSAISNYEPVEDNVNELLTGLGGQQAIWPIPVNKTDPSDGVGKISVGEWTGAIFDVASNVTQEELLPILNVFFAQNKESGGNCKLPGNCMKANGHVFEWDEGLNESGSGSSSAGNSGSAAAVAAAADASADAAGSGSGGSTASGAAAAAGSGRKAK